MFAHLNYSNLIRLLHHNVVFQFAVFYFVFIKMCIFSLALELAVHDTHCSIHI